jgi:hypothetical protein
MTPSELFSQLVYGDDEMADIRGKIAYDNFDKSVPDDISLKEYINTIYRKNIDDTNQQNIYFSEIYMIRNYMLSDVVVDDEYWNNLSDKISQIRETQRELPKHINGVLALIDNIKANRALTKEVLLYLNDVYKGNY